MYKYGINIPPYTKIGSGLYIGHFGCITVSPNVIIGKNCNVSPGIAIGQVNRGIRKGWPVIGDNVYIGPGAKIIGNVTIGNNVAIGANCVVTRDIPDNAVVVGIPGKVISYKGSEGYINNIDY
jgi:serine O-acetyltransferase